MTDKYWLTNLAAGEFIRLEVEDGEGLAEAARTHLANSGLSAEIQQGFYVSIYPIAADTSDEEDSSEPAEDESGPENANPGPSQLDVRSEPLDEKLEFDPADGVKA